ncbi:MAG: hypothetical protein SCH98_13760 [Deferrisomatales bacterium]|nr:hypothetical protein [Deferrisomatales bacterium]
MRGHPLDQDLLTRVQQGAAHASRVWEPDAVGVVLGRGSRAESEVDAAACEADGVPLLRRRGGGGAVVLGPGCLVASLARRVSNPLAVERHLGEAADLLALALARAGGVPLVRRGSGDLCHGDRKVVGSSAFCGRGVFFYQASLLVDLDLSLVDRYLPHPSREPAYRQGRPHREFLTTLRRAGFQGSSRSLAEQLGAALREALAGAGTGFVTRAGLGV